MLFNSIEFILFFSLVTLLYYITNYKYRWIILLAANYIFYMAGGPKYVIYILITTFTTYATAIIMDKLPTKGQKKKFLILNLVVNIGILFTLKYFNFISLSLNSIFKSISVSYEFPTFNLILPIGISFYTFKALGYSIDVYRGDIKAEKHFGIFALFLSFFPQVLSGPIERSYNLLPQFYEKHEVDLNKIKDGLILMLWGFFKKIVIADNLAIFVNHVFNNPHSFTGIPLIMASVFFAFQIYYDFSGYSDVAIGCAKVLGFDSMKNFDKPYTSKSITEFWRKWHISLSSWFKDYVYIPLGGNRVSTSRWCFNQLVVFLLSGLWHGANWTFVLWGLLHGIFTIISKLTRNIRSQITNKLGLDKYPKIHYAMKVMITFILVDFAWIFFRANSVSDAIYIVSNMFTNIRDGLSLTSISELLVAMGISIFNFKIITIFTVLLGLIEFYENYSFIGEMVNKKPFIIRWGFYYLLIFSIILLGGYGYEEHTQFIYVQF